LQAVEGIVEGVEEKSLPFGRLQVENPMVACFSQEHRPLSQYDMDMLPEFKDISPEEQRWLADLNADVYVPIYTKEKWIGLFALGQKISGSRYYEQDLTLLSTLADQSVVALENARLLANLKKLNTDLENAYKALEKANQDLREMDELKSAFIGVITHELRTPLANVGFSLQIFEMYGLKHLPPEQRSQFDQLKSSFQMASMMIENLVTYASFLNNQVKLRLERLNIKDIVREVVTPLKIMSDEKGVNLKVDIIGELPPINADRKLLSNAMHQLVHNAVKFTKEGGKVWITCWATTDAVCFDVKDTGVGIPISKLPGMWSEFTQMADPLKRGVEGLGLGLALVKYIIAAHGGEVWAESQEGVGSVFGFQMPVGAARQPRRPSDIFRKRVTYQRSS
jgi:K+-sensing histidine kinase KdpD